ncbi:unnamed protein product, partial [Mesorhabditis belari]|uniref:G-protein coupled receptors family 1 profile domain-containing protein n=1 Tax=Mesorhabditis belari TaxID=2138241 RepID=A0AAF3EPP2_9BILA
MDDVLIERVHEDGWWFLVGLFNMEGLLTLLSLYGNILLLWTLKRYSVFHDHLRVISTHFTFCVILASVYSLLRASMGIYHISFPPTEDPIENVNLSCDLAEMIPFSLCLQLCVLSIILSVERFYATLNYSRYEQQNIERPLRYILFITWLPIAVPLAHILSSATSHQSLQHCAKQISSKSLLARNIGVTIALLCEFLFTAIFCALKMLNGQRQTEYIQHHYRSLSTRFQIGENLRTCALMSSLHLLTLIFFVTALLSDLLVTGDQTTTDIRRESSHILLPLYTFMFPIIFVGNDAMLRRKYMLVMRSFFSNSPKEKTFVDNA